MDLLERALLYGRTARHLRWEQWVYRPVRRAQGRLPLRLEPEASGPAPERFAQLRAAVLGWGPGDARARTRAADAVLRGEFRFLNHTELLPGIDWGARHVSHLWNYNLHYFDFALDLAWAHHATGDERYLRRFEELALGWIESTVPGKGDGWEPYALSLRAVNWIHALLLFGHDLPSAARGRLEASLAAQLDFLSRRLELHILANHLQKNLKALVVGGLYLSGPAPERWLRDGTRALWPELFEQVLPDGTHYERSPMYHAIALGDFLEVVSLLDGATLPVPGAARERLRAMAGALGVLCRPDGRLHLFNDAAEGIAPGREWLSALSLRALGEAVPDPEGAVALPHGGFRGVVSRSRGERLLIDCGAPGPSYQPGHSHCGTLGYELDLVDTPVVVDSGVRGYDADPLREYVRSTRAHNTVSIAGREQSEVWGTFRMARRAVMRGARHEASGGRYRFEGACSPYHDRGATHHRRLEAADGRWTVTDRVEGARGAPLTSYLHLHPELTVVEDSNRFLARSGRVCVAIEPFGADGVRLRRGESEPAQGWYCPEFGVSLPAFTLELEVESNDGRSFGYSLEVVEK